jgi:hypothetical protein
VGEAKCKVPDLCLSDGQYLEKLDAVCNESPKAVSSFPAERADRLDAGRDALAEFRSGDHNLGVTLEPPGFLGCDRSLDAIDVFASSLLRISLGEKPVPKPPTGKISFLDRVSTKWDDDLL